MGKQFVALLWKEWRQMRAVFLALAIGCPVFIVAAWAYVGFKPDAGDAVSGAALLFIVFATLVIPSSAFTGERRSRELTFLMEQPVAAWKICLAKLLVGGALWLALLALAAAVGRLCSQTALFAVSPRGIREFFGPDSPGRARFHTWAGFAAASLRLLPLFICCFWASAGLERPVVAMLFGAVLAGALVAAMHLAYPYYLIVDLGLYYIDLVAGTDAEWQALHALNLVLVGIVCLAPLGLAWFVFTRVRDAAMSVRRRAGVFGKAVGIGALISVVPHTVAFSFEQVRLAVMQPRDAGMVYWLRPSPDGRRLAFAARFEMLPFTPPAERWCVVNTETGEGQVCTRLRESSGDWASWSPGGRYVLYRASQSWLSDIVALAGWRLLGTGPRGKQRLGILDVRTGRNWQVGSRTVGRMSFEGWLDEGEMLVSGLYGRHYRYRVGSDRLRRLGLPGEGEGARWELCSLRRRGRLHFVSEEPPQVAAYDRASKRWVASPLPPRTMITDVSADARHAVVVTRTKDEDESPAQIHLLNLSDGSTRLLPTPSHKAADHVACFLSPKGRWVYLRIASQAAQPRQGTWLFEVPTGRRLALPLPEGAEISAGQAAPFYFLGFSSDESQVVWLRRRAAPMEEEAGRLRFHVYDIARRRFRALPIPSRGPRGGEARLTPQGLIFTCRWAAIYRIRLDGTCLERLFPERRPLTLEEFDAETASE